MLNFPNIGHSWTENWLFKLANDNSTYLYLAFQDETYSGDFYEGAISNKPSIRESINLANSTSKTGNISITIADYNYNGSPISEELFGGVNHYINQEVTVHSRVNSETPIQIGSFRLTDISTDGDKIQLSMTAHRPWDFISIPQTKSSDKNIFFPIAYGDFTPNGTARDYRAIKTLRPMPVNEFRGTQLYSLIGIEDVTSNAYPHYYDKSFDKFIPVSEDGSYNFDTNSDGYKGGFAVEAHYELEKRITFKPSETTSSTGWTNPDNAFDDADANEATNYTNADFTQSNAGTSTKTIKFKMPQIEGKVTAVSMEISYTTTRIVSISSGTPTVTFTLTNKTWGVSDAFFNVAITSAGTTSSSITTDASGSLLTQFNAQDGWGDEIEIEAKVVCTGIGSYSGQFQPRIYDVRILTTTEVDWSDKQTANKIVSDIGTLYTGGDGLTHGITGLSGNAITEIHDAHLDLLNRFVGLDVATNPTTNIDGWTSLNTDRTGWNLRWWTVEPIDLIKALEKLQYEGCFIFRFKADGSPQYIHIADSPSVDFTLTKEDIKGFSVKHTPFSELLTKMELSYEKHPAENKYISTSTVQNSSVRTDWNIQAKENIKQVNLDALVSSIGSDMTDDPNDGFVPYYANIYGDIKIQVSGTVVNPNYYNMEVGDIANFSSMHPEKAFGQSWSGKNFMITGLTRSVGTLKFEGREI